MIVTIDGPAGAGKSTAARRLAERLGFDFLDTGAMYRVVTLMAIRAEVASTDEPRLTQLLAGLTILVEHGRAFANGEEVTADIRTPEVTSAVRHFADKAVVRRHLVAQQQAIGRGRNLVTEGRDQGTVVFPSAECKFFLTADEKERAERRQRDFARQGRTISVEEVLADQQLRDKQDQERQLAPLTPATDACIVDTSGLSVEATLDLMERYVRSKMKQSLSVPEQYGRPNHH